MDCDLATDLSCIDEFVDCFKVTNAIVIGDRTHPKSKTKRVWLRSILTYLLGLVISNVLKTKVNDGQCGFKLFPLNKTVKTIFSNLKTRNYSFDLELLQKSLESGLLIQNKEVIWTEYRERGLGYILKIAFQLTQTMWKIKTSSL